MSLVTPPGASERVLRFRLFVAGQSARSRRAIENLRRMVDSELAGPCEVEVVDVLLCPEQAEAERILATPTLLREAPEPRKRVTGDLTDLESVLRVVAPDVFLGPSADA